VTSQLLIVKTGSTFPDTLLSFGDFEDWIRRGLDVQGDTVDVIDMTTGGRLPPARVCQGVIIGGSHAMVTDDLPWMDEITGWIADLVRQSVPLLGICFGHQLMAKAMGGEVDYHPMGKEIGTVGIDLLPFGAGDTLFRSFSSRFAAHVTHSQTVVRLPVGAVRLAGNTFETNHAFRLGPCAWGVQFHPEFDASIMDSYVVNQAAELGLAGLDVSALRASIAETPEAEKILRRFAELVFSDQRTGEG
jgi:GMP synthase (glutamine-hydrolysing)